MVNQKVIAQELGLNQSTVSRALKGDRQIPEQTRRLVQETAERMGYRPNPMVTSLMEHIRMGKARASKGSIIIIVDRVDQKEWFLYDAYRQQYQGFVQRAESRGFSTECFFIGGNKMSAPMIDRICHQRGVDGICFSAPTRDVMHDFQLSWDRYSCSKIAYSWDNLPMNQVSTNHRRNADRCYRELLSRGYRRIGMIVDVLTEHWVDDAWLASYCLHRLTVSPHESIPHFVVNVTRDQREEFHQWQKQWQPTAIVCAGQSQAEWLDQNNLLPVHIPRVLCCRPANSRYAGMDENNEMVGATLCDVLTAKILHNERGLQDHPQTVLIEGTWCDAPSLPDKAPKQVERLQKKLSPP